MTRGDDMDSHAIGTLHSGWRIKADTAAVLHVCCRYGPVQVELLGRMAQARRRLLVGSSVATQMGVMAWKQQTSEVTP